MAAPDADASRQPGAPGADRHWLAAAIDLSKRCARSATAFSVGALVVGGSGQVIATGYSRETGETDHAEELALRRAQGKDLAGATLFSSLEPCLHRKSRPTSCAELIAAAGLRRVVIAWREPPVFVPGGGATWLAARGITLVELPELAPASMAVNDHLLTR